MFGAEFATVAPMTKSELTRRAALLCEFFDAAPMKHAFGMELGFDDAGNGHFCLP